MFSFSELSYALVAGYNQDDQKSRQKMEVIYTGNGTTKICRSTVNYPEKVWYITGGSFLKINLLITCGGYPPTSACYSMNNDLKWSHFANLTKPNRGIESVIVKNELWLTGTDVISPKLSIFFNMSF